MGRDINIFKFGADGRLADCLFLFFMLGAAIAVYYPSLQGPFVFDDQPNISLNPAIRMTEFSAAALKKAAFDSPMPTRPVANISFALNYLAGKYGVFGYHLVNILLHAITGFILFLFFRISLQLADGSEVERSFTILSFVAASIWLVHPLQSQAVAYIVQRMTILASLFYLLSLLLYVHARLAVDRKRRLPLFAGSVLAGALALGSKEIAATLPIFIFLYEWFFFQDLDRSWLKRHLPYLGFTLVAFLVLALFYLNFDPIGRVLATYQGREFTLSERLLTELRVIVFYLGQLVFPSPARLSLEHDIALSTSLFSPLSTVFSAVFLLALVGLSVRAAKKDRLIFFALIWYLGNLVIESSVIGLEPVFEHRNYLPSMFIVLSMVLLAARTIRWAGLKSILAGLLIIIFSFWTHQRSGVWGDEEALMRDSLEKAPGKFRVYYNLGTLLSEKGRTEEAIEIYNRGLEKFARSGSARGRTRLYENLGILYTNLGNALARKGQYSEADNAYYRALKINPKDPNAYLGLGNNALVQENYERAESHYRRALSLAKDPTLKSNIRRSLRRAVQGRQ